MSQGGEAPNAQRLRELAARAAAIEEQTRAALAGTVETAPAQELPDPSELRFAVWRKKAEREFAARLAAALAERDNNADNPYKVAAAERLEALEESTRIGDELRAALETSEEKRLSLEQQVEALTATCTERLDALEEATRAADELRRALEGTDEKRLSLEHQVEALTATCAERLDALTESTRANEALRLRADELARACDERLRALEENARDSEVMRAEIQRLGEDNAHLTQRAAELQRVCDERLAALEALHGEYAAVAKEAAARAELIEQLRAHAPASG